MEKQQSATGDVPNLTDLPPERKPKTEAELALCKEFYHLGAEHAKKVLLGELKNAEALGVASPYTYRSAGIMKLTLALAKAQAAFTTVEKSKTSGKGSVKEYKYADLADVIKATAPALTGNELALTQLVTWEGDKQWLESLLLHSSGEWIKSHMVLPVMRDPKDFGQVLTYSRRYAQQAMLNVAAEEDLDGVAGHEGNDRGGGRDNRQSRGPKPNMEHPKGPGPKDVGQPAGFVGHAVIPRDFGPVPGKKLEDLTASELEAYVALYADTTATLPKPAKAFKAIFDRYVAHRKKAAETPKADPVIEGPDKELANAIAAAIKSGAWAVEGLKKASMHLYKTDVSENLTVDQIVDFTTWVKNGTYVQFAEHHNLK